MVIKAFLFYLSRIPQEIERLLNYLIKHPHFNVGLNPSITLLNHRSLARPPCKSALFFQCLHRFIFFFLFLLFVIKNSHKNNNYRNNEKGFYYHQILFSVKIIVFLLAHFMYRNQSTNKTRRLPSDLADFQFQMFLCFFETANSYPLIMLPNILNSAEPPKKSGSK